MSAISDLAADRCTMQPERLALDGRRFCALAFSDLFHGEHSSANAAAPGGRRKWCRPWRMLGRGMSGSHQVAVTLRTFSFNHGLNIERRL